MTEAAPYVPSWHPQDYRVLPDIIETQMLASDILLAHRMMIETRTVCPVCPVAQVMLRTFPEFGWSIGSRDTTAMYRQDNGKVTPDLAAGFALDKLTIDWIGQIPMVLGHEFEGTDEELLSAISEPILVRARKFTPEWSRADWIRKYPLWS